MEPSNLIDQLIGAKSGLEVITFEENHRTFECVLPCDSLWGSLKDNVLLQEYERAGISLDDVSGPVVDAGAHVGIFSLRASAHADVVVSLEAGAENFHLLELNLGRNLRDKPPRCHAKHAALWSSRGEIAFREGNHSGGGQVSAAVSGDKVAAITLGDIVDTWGRIGLLKLDIEGAEFAVLRSAPTDVLRRIDAIVGELHLDVNPGGDVEIEQRLTQVGFRVSILPAPIHDWKDSVKRLLSNRKHLRGHWRLKSVTAGTYVLFPLVDRVFDLGRRINSGSLRFLYARR